MNDVKSSALSRFLHQYKGVEGFYFLNRQGELGYITNDSSKTIKETFPQLNNKDFIGTHAQFQQELEGFLREIADLCTVYLTSRTTQIEIGYVLPVSDSQSWHSATLVLHKHVLDTIEQDERQLYAKGIKDPFNGNPDAQKSRGVRSVQQGLDDLLNHKDVFGVYRYFPVLFNDSGQSASEPKADQPRAKLTVLNLRWRQPDQTHDQTNVAGYNAYEDVYTVLRTNLIAHGAIDRTQRLQYRFDVS